MLALLLTRAGHGALQDLARPVAGAPLLRRQLEWLARNGVTYVALNRVGHAPLPAPLRELHPEELGIRLAVIPSTEPLDPGELCDRVEYDRGPVVVVPHAVLGSLDLREEIDRAVEDDVDVELASFTTAIRICRPLSPRPLERVEPRDGWLDVIEGERAAHWLTCNVLSGRRGSVQIVGSPIEKGIFRARGSVIEEGAVLREPVYVGAGAFVQRGAVIGPFAVLDPGVVVEAGAHVERSRVAEGTVVGPGVSIRNALAHQGTIVRHDGLEIALDDALLVGTTAPAHRPLVATFLAWLCLLLLAPLALVSERAREFEARLTQVARGQRTWLGVPSADRPFVFDVTPALVPPGAEAPERQSAWLFYRAKKQTWLDLRLALSLLVARHSQRAA